MSNPILFRLLDAVEGTFARVTGKPYTPVMQQICDEGLSLYDQMNGRHDVPERVPSRTLVVPEEDREMVQAFGAIELNGEWIVPEGEDLEPFENWWPQPPEDLRDKQERGLKTKDGMPIEGYRLPEDMVLGSDSTATPLLYAAFPVIGAFAYMLTMFGWGKAALASLLLSVPFLVSLKQHESFWEAIKSAALLLIGPLAVALMVTDPATVMKTAGAMPGSNKMISSLASLGILLNLAIFGPLVFALFDNKAKSTVVGGGKSYSWSAFLERVKHNFKWTAFVAMVLGVAFLVSMKFPAAVPFAIFMLACMYPMVHTEANYMARAKTLEQLGINFNLGLSGALSSMHIQPRADQALNAAKDTSPVIRLATASGWLTKKMYPFAPDADLPMVGSAKDLKTHLLVLGAPGMGKTEGVMRNVAKQWIESGYGGFVCLCGKGSLPGELSALLDLLVGPGVDYAPMQGLSAQEVAYALNSIDVGKRDVWDAGAKDFIEHLTLLHEALRDHELNYRAYACKMARVKEEESDRFKVSIAANMKAGNVDEAQFARSELDKVVKSLNSWKDKRDSKRHWLWNLDTLSRLRMMANSFTITNSAELYCKEFRDALQYLGYPGNGVGATPEYQARLKSHPKSIHPEIGQGSLLDGTLEFFMRGWAGLDAKQRGSFLINVDLRLSPLTRGKFLTGKSGVHWKMLETGEDISCALYGKSVGFDVPATKHGAASEAVAAFAKQRFYADVKKRALESEESWMAKGQKPLMFMIDEAHLIVGEQEADLASISRSLHMTFVCATQAIESFITRLGDKDKALLLMSQFQSFIAMKS